MRPAIRNALGLAAMAAALASCGGRQPLKPVEGQKPPAVPIGGATPPTAQDLTTPTTQERPERGVELMKQSEQREDDPFDLPPERAP